jgi:hypothetical protein
MQEQQTRLPLHEWMAVIAILFLIFVLLAVVILKGNDGEINQLDHPHHIISQEFEVFVEGAVEKPGPYTVKRGSTLQDAINLAVPNSEAKLDKFKMEKKLRKGQVIKVPKISKKSSQNKKKTKDE